MKKLLIGLFVLGSLAFGVEPKSTPETGRYLGKVLNIVIAKSGWLTVIAVSEDDMTVNTYGFRQNGAIPIRFSKSAYDNMDNRHGMRFYLYEKDGKYIIRSFEEVYK